MHMICLSSVPKMSALGFVVNSLKEVQIWSFYFPAIAQTDASSSSGISIFISFFEILWTGLSISS